MIWASSRGKALQHRYAEAAEGRGAPILQAVSNELVAQAPAAVLLKELLKTRRLVLRQDAPLQP